MVLKKFRNKKGGRTFSEGWGQGTNDIKACADKANKKRIKSMNYETESCVYCEASASLLSRKIKSFNIKDLKNDFVLLKKISNKRNIKFPKKYSEFKKLLNSDNFNRFKCIFLPFDAVIKALKL